MANVEFWQIHWVSYIQCCCEVGSYYNPAARLQWSVGHRVRRVNQFSGNYTCRRKSSFRRRNNGQGRWALRVSIISELTREKDIRALADDISGLLVHKMSCRSDAGQLTVFHIFQENRVNNWPALHKIGSFEGEFSVWIQHGGLFMKRRRFSEEQIIRRYGIAEQMLDNAVLKDVLLQKWWAHRHLLFLNKSNVYS